MPFLRKTAVKRLRIRENKNLAWKQEKIMSNITEKEMKRKCFKGDYWMTRIKIYII